MARWVAEFDGFVGEAEDDAKGGAGAFEGAEEVRVGFGVDFEDFSGCDGDGEGDYVVGGEAVGVEVEGDAAWERVLGGGSGGGGVGSVPPREKPPTPTEP